MVTGRCTEATGTVLKRTAGPVVLSFSGSAVADLEEVRRHYRELSAPEVAERFLKRSSGTSRNWGASLWRGALSPSLASSSCGKSSCRRFEWSTVSIRAESGSSACGGASGCSRSRKSKRQSAPVAG